MKLELLILTQPSRAEFLRQLTALLYPQTQNEEVAVTIRYFDPRLTLGCNREQLRQESQAEYICFIDDDDFISPNYVQKILPHLDGKVDQVSFDVQIFRNGEPVGIGHHELKHGEWHEKPHAYYRDISHLCPMRRELALEVPMQGGIGEDHRWADLMRGRVKTDYHVSDVLYFYLWRTPKNDRLDHLANWRRKIYEELTVEHRDSR